MDEVTAVIIAGISLSARTFIEKVSEAVGGIFHPIQVERNAKAEAAAAIIHAHKDVQLSDIQRRAAIRHLDEETQRQINMESIAQRSLTWVKPEAEPAKMEKDWITAFFDKARLIEDNDMQTLWAKILAGEANRPGRFSKRTLSIVSDLSKEDADKFLKLRCHCVSCQDISFAVVRSNWAGFNTKSILFSELTHLESLGLIAMSNFMDYAQEFKDPHQMVEYYGRFVAVDLNLAKDQKQDKKFQLNCGSVILTAFGKELSAICEGSPVTGFYDHLIDFWKQYNAKEVTDTEGDAQVSAVRPVTSTCIAAD
jgi:hypothetical protein